MEQLKGFYSDSYGMDEFECLILACSIDGERYLILDIEENVEGWCSCHLVDDNQC